MREFEGDEIGVTGGQSLQNGLQLTLFYAEYLSRADAVGLDVVIQQPGDCELVIPAAGLRKLEQGVENYERRPYLTFITCETPFAVHITEIQRCSERGLYNAFEIT